MNTPGFKAALGSIIGILATGVIIYFVVSLVAGIIKFFMIAGVIILALGISYTYIRSVLKDK